ncbi:Importin alpha subunit (Karyopherin alpha subunit) (Serine-rich RNA polymerase I suppressor protein) [Tulasnella sp. 417]|nr:Importin alpha subunit (Karyopherin alpha subunit) (Serine-rich RNA polymerase I suppressor protein) [Tulasnella sp. 417]
MADETLKDITVELSGLTLEGISQIEVALTEDGKIPEALVLGLRSDDLQIQRAAITTIRRIQAAVTTIQPNQAAELVINAGLVLTLVSLLDSDDTTLQFLGVPKCEAACILANVAFGTTEQTAEVVEAGAIPKFVTLSASPSEDVSINAVWALANIVGDSPSLRNCVEADGGIDALARLLNHSQATPRRVQRRSVKHLVPLLARYIQEATMDESALAEDNESVTYAIQSLNRILDLGFPRSDVIETGVVPRLVRLLADSSSGTVLQREVFRFIGYLIAGDDEDTDATIQAGLLPALLVHLDAKNGELCRRALWSASNIAAGSQSQAHALVDHGLLKPAVHILMDDQSARDCRREACWTISNLSDKISGDVKMAQAFIDERCIEGLSAALQIPDAKIRELGISAITNVLQYQDSQGLQVEGSLHAITQSSSIPQGLRHIRDSRTSEAAALRKGCHALLTQYFPEYSKRARV